MKQQTGKYSINWNDKDTKKALIRSTVNDIIVKLFRDKHPEVVEKIEKMVKDSSKKP